MSTCRLAAFATHKIPRRACPAFPSTRSGRQHACTKQKHHGLPRRVTARRLLCLQIICGRWDDASYRARRCPPDEFQRRFAVHGVDRVWRCSTAAYTMQQHRTRTPHDACTYSGAAQIAHSTCCSHYGEPELTACWHWTFAGTMCCRVGCTAGESHICCQSRCVHAQWLLSGLGFRS